MRLQPGGQPWRRVPQWPWRGYRSKWTMARTAADGGRGFYCDAVAGPAYERHLLEDVIGFVDRMFNTIPERQGLVIGGL
jgi:hypothetical protein